MENLLKGSVRQKLGISTNSKTILHNLVNFHNLWISHNLWVDPAKARLLNPTLHEPSIVPVHGIRSKEWLVFSLTFLSVRNTGAEAMTPRHTPWVTPVPSDQYYPLTPFLGKINAICPRLGTLSMILGLEPKQVPWLITWLILVIG